jgi:hypothetical protein
MDFLTGFGIKLQAQAKPFNRVAITKKMCFLE